jgi:hypothetical protein
VTWVPGADVATTPPENSLGSVSPNVMRRLPGYLLTTMIDLLAGNGKSPDGESNSRTILLDSHLFNPVQRSRIR